jgi:hypothetical protein
MLQALGCAVVGALCYTQTIDVINIFIFSSSPTLFGLVCRAPDSNRLECIGLEYLAPTQARDDLQEGMSVFHIGPRCFICGLRDDMKVRRRAEKGDAGVFPSLADPLDNGITAYTG